MDLGSTFAGTPLYMAPEMLNGHTYKVNGDMYSLGCLLYMLCTNDTPYTANNIDELVVCALRQLVVCVCTAHALKHNDGA